MTPGFAFRALTPLGRGLVLMTILLVLVGVGHGLGLRWDPFDLSGRRLRRAEARAVAAEGVADARGREAEGRAAQQPRLDRHHRTAVSVARLAERAATQARSAHDASIPLDPARLDRLREHDRRLCEAAPSVCGAPEADPADGGHDALSSRQAG